MCLNTDPPNTNPQNNNKNLNSCLFITLLGPGRTENFTWLPTLVRARELGDTYVSGGNPEVCRPPNTHKLRGSVVRIQSLCKLSVFPHFPTCFKVTCNWVLKHSYTVNSKNVCSGLGYSFVIKNKHVWGLEFSPRYCKTKQNKMKQGCEQKLEDST